MHYHSTSQHSEEKACVWVDSLPPRLRLDFQRGYESVLRSTGIQLKGPVVNYDIPMLRKLFIDSGADANEINGLSDEECVDLVESFSIHWLVAYVILSGMECLTVIPKAQMQPVLFYGELFLLRRTSE
jgi:hypothetical protein